MSEADLDVMPWPEWQDYRRFADWRLGLKKDEGGDEEYG